jgi:hypothetical protein
MIKKMRIYMSFLMVAGVAIALSGCGKKEIAVEVTPVPSNAQNSTDPVPSPVARDVSPVTSAESTTDLQTLTQALRRYSMERRKVPADLNEVMAAGYLKGMPTAPAGKKFGINTKRLEVILVNK